MSKYYVDNNINVHDIPSSSFSIELLGEKNKDEFEEFINSKIRYCIDLYFNIEVSKMDSIVGFRKLHKQFGEKSKKMKSSPETLIKYLQNKNSIPRVLPLVDIYNIVSIKYALALGAHDLDRIIGNVVLKLTTGNEVFCPIGTSDVEKICMNEYGYFDDGTAELLCRLETRQSETTKITNDTKKVIFILQGNSYTDKSHIINAKKELLSYIDRFFTFTLIDDSNYFEEIK